MPKFLSPLDLGNNEFKNAVIQNLDTAPLNVEPGLIYFNTSDSSLYIYDGTQWVNLFKGLGGSSAAKAYMTNVGDGTSKSFIINHNFGTRDVSVTIYENGNKYEEVLADIYHTDENNITVEFSTIPTENQYRITISLLSSIE